MPDIKISRTHSLGLAEARKVAYKWAEDAEKKLDMECTYEEGKTADEVQFTRSGVDGTLKVTATGFDLHAKLGFLLGAFKGKIESEIEKNLDALLAKSAEKNAEKSTAGAKKAAAKKKA
jgi:putative polyhydroxyalkanoate system protein